MNDSHMHTDFNTILVSSTRFIIKKINIITKPILPILLLQLHPQIIKMPMMSPTTSTRWRGCRYTPQQLHPLVVVPAFSVSPSVGVLGTPRPRCRWTHTGCEGLGVGATVAQLVTASEAKKKRVCVF